MYKAKKYKMLGAKRAVQIIGLHNNNYLKHSVCINYTFILPGTGL